MMTWPFDADGMLTGEEGYRVVQEVRPLTPGEAADFERELAELSVHG
jgi:hypothetical protein